MHISKYMQRWDHRQCCDQRHVYTIGAKVHILKQVGGTTDNAVIQEVSNTTRIYRVSQNLCNRQVYCLPNNHHTEWQTRVYLQFIQQHTHPELLACCKDSVHILDLYIHTCRPWATCLFQDDPFTRSIDKRFALVLWFWENIGHC